MWKLEEKNESLYQRILLIPSPMVLEQQWNIWQTQKQLRELVDSCGTHFCKWATNPRNQFIQDQLLAGSEIHCQLSTITFSPHQQSSPTHSQQILLIIIIIIIIITAIKLVFPFAAVLWDEQFVTVSFKSTNGTQTFPSL